MDYNTIAEDMSDGELVVKVNEIIRGVKEEVDKAYQYAAAVDDADGLADEIQDAQTHVQRVQDVAGERLEYVAKRIHTNTGVVTTYESPGGKTGPQDAIVVVDVDRVQQRVTFTVGFEDEGPALNARDVLTMGVAYVQSHHPNRSVSAGDKEAAVPFAFATAKEYLETEAFWDFSDIHYPSI